MREIKINGKAYQIEYGMNAICDIEDATGKSLDELFEYMKKHPQSMRIIRVLLWAGLESSRSITIEAAGNLLDTADNIADVVGALSEEFAASLNSKFQTVNADAEKKMTKAE